MYDVAVLGLGAMGAATLYQLAKRGINAIGIDQFNPPHTNGSTHGETRLTRCAIGEGHQYVPFAIRSHEIWKELGNETGEQLLFETGALMIESALGGGSVHGSANFLDTTISTAKQFNIAHEVLSGLQARQRFPSFATNDQDKAYYEPGAGYLKVEECVSAQLNRAVELGADLLIDTKVHSISHANEHVELATSGNPIHAKKLVVCAGPWVKELLGAPYDTKLTTTRQVLHWYPIAQNAMHEWKDHPVFIWIHGEGEGYYGLPSLDDPTLIKVANANYGEPSAPDAVNRDVDPKEQTEMFDVHLKGRLMGIKPQAHKSVTCIYTVTPDSDFILDWHMDHKNTFVVSACSGHGFKHSAAIGEAVAQQLIDGTSTIDISAFNMTRFKD
ncbi:N-methyl-L-tryptophan oxidase [Maritalea porphyrae]|uniref:N-methyl-L-tryptophan oxidase n=1 Tax=Maritalea porphyrae TaxID=880732 RepID=UPI0022AF6ED6|nr:N-methyl-L-tryptophan oxidase [Maritalea porphyrae]MCZ4273512.1 N-methyl-L-tryptophan oxidase [Maritalea porphyrae]